MLKKILEEIEEEKLKHWDPSERLDTDKLIGWCFEKCKDIIRKHMNEGKDINVPAKDNDGWIPVEDQDRLPKDDEYIFLSFENFDLPMVGRYKTNKEGGAFYLGDEEDTCISQDLYVNAWQPLPKPYRPEQRNPSPQGKGEKEENMKLGILNTSILTAAGEYTLKDIDLDTAKDLVSQNDLD